MNAILPGSPGKSSSTGEHASPVWRNVARRAWFVARVLGVLALIAGLAWWFALSPIAVSVHVVSRGTVTAEVLGTGTLEARVSATVGPKIGGLIENISVDQGDQVKAGDTLVRLQDTDFRHQVGVAEAEVAAGSATLDRLHAEDRRAQAVLAQADVTHERLRQATAANASSRQELDKAVEALAIAHADVARATAAIIEGQKRLDAAKRLLEFQRARLDDTTIKAPFDALVVRRDRDAGDVVTAGSSVLQLVSLEETWITAWVDETELSRLTEGQYARVVFRAEPGNEYAGSVARIGRETDRETREVIVDVRVERLPQQWAVGQRAEVYIRVDQKRDVVLLPAALLLLRDGTPGVMVEQSGVARWREVVIGLRGRDAVEVTSGIVEGDAVVRPVSAGTTLREGRKVTHR